MKRNWGLIKDILKSIEEDRFETYAEEYLDKVEARYLDTKERLQAQWVFYGHLELLMDEDFIRGLNLITNDYGDSPMLSIKRPRLSSSGFDLLDALSTQSVWDSVYKYAKENAIPITFELLKTFLLKAMAVDS